VPLALAAALSSRAAPAEEVALTLAQALETASRQNPEIVAARERASAQAARAESVGRGRWPRLSVTSGWTRTDNPAMVFANKLNAGEFTQQDFAIERLNSPDAISHLQTTLSLDAPIDVFGKIGAQAGAQSASGRAAEAGLREAGATLRLRVVEAYRRAEVARRAVAVTERALAGARSRESDMEARVAEGATLRADLLRARARRREREADLADRRGAARIAAATLGRLLGAPPETSFVPVDAAPTPAPLAGDESAWIARALTSRPSLESARQRVEGAGLGERAEQRTILPDIGVFAQFLDDRNTLSHGGQSGVVGAVVRWNAFDPARGKRVAVASAELRATREDLRAAQDAVRLEVAAAFWQAETARERHAAAAGGAEEGREALRVIQERRQAGVATLTDELETESASLDAELTEIQAAAEAAIADAALARAAGEL
jgi:outer membrane protein TolC